MEIIEKIKNHKHFHIGKNFAKYLITGIIYTVLTIFLMWFIIDYIGIPTVVGASLVVVFVFFTKYYIYRAIRFMQKGFLKYTSTVISFHVANVVLMWLFVDILRIPTVISSSIVVVGLFILRFIVFYIIGLVKK